MSARAAGPGCCLVVGWAGMVPPCHALHLAPHRPAPLLLLQVPKGLLVCVQHCIQQQLVSVWAGLGCVASMRWEAVRDLLQGLLQAS